MGQHDRGPAPRARSFANGNGESNASGPQPARRRDWQTQLAQMGHATFWQLV